MRISAAIQHHPARASLLAPLRASLAPLDVQVAVDPLPAGKPAAWRAYRLALESTPPDATHRLIVQDDAEPCADFALLLERAIAAEPDRLLVLCVCGLPAELARAVNLARHEGRAWAELRSPRWIPAIALLWPTPLIPEALDWIDRQTTWPRDFLADDEILMRTMAGLGETPLATVPSLVQHPDRVVSVIGKRKPLDGANPGRVAAWYDPAPDPLLVDY